MGSNQQASGGSEPYGQRAFSILQGTWNHELSSDLESSQHCTSHLPEPSNTRRRDSISEDPFTEVDIQTFDDGASSKETVLYLAYGSNLSAETFKGTRGIRPLSSINVQCPSLDLTFDLPGLPYAEPCFANSAYRNPAVSGTDYHKLRWHKGLIGVVYEVTKKDYATIVATEGGGASYRDITVPCFPIPSGTQIVDPNPTTEPFKAHTLFSPRKPHNGWGTRPDPNYAQPSARYLKLITDGAKEHALPKEYLDYLCDLQPYTITTRRQKAGRLVVFGIWGPIFAAVLGLNKAFADDKGRVPKWLASVMGFVFGSVWKTYDTVFYRLFGDGERTLEKRDAESIVGEKSALLQ
jgi:hypothetical protein